MSHSPPLTIAAVQPFLAKIWLISAVVSSIVYGIEITLGVMCINALSKSSKYTSRRMRMWLILFVIFMCFLGTAAVVFTAVTLIIAFINPGDIVKSLKGNYLEIFLQPFSPLEMIFVVLATWGSYGLLIWRCSILYQAISRPKWIIFLVFVTIISLVSLAFGFMGILTMAPGVRWTSTIILTVFEITSFFVNGSVSCLVAGRILYHQWRLRKVFGKGYGGAYTRIVVIFIESSLLTLVWDGILMILGFGFEGKVAVINDLSMVIIKLLLHMNIIAPILIILRVARGRAETSHTGTNTRIKISNIRFPSNIFGAENGNEGENPGDVANNSGPKLSVIAP